MATFKKVFKFRASVGGTGSPRQLNFPEAATQTFKKGDFVYLVNGLVTVCASTPTTALILGMAMADASGVTNTQIPVLIADDNVEWALPYGNSNTTAGVATAVADVGLAGGYALAYVAVSGVSAWCVDHYNTSNHHLMVVEIDKTYPVGTTAGTYWVKVQPAFRQLD